MTKSTLDPSDLSQATAAPLPLPGPDLPDDSRQSEIEARAAAIDLNDTGTIIGFGATAQAELQQISQAMLADVRNKDLGAAGDTLRQMIATIRGFSTEELDPDRKRTLWDRLIGKAGGVSDILSTYETVQGQIDQITASLDRHEHTLLKDIKALDQLYAKTLAYFDELGLYIAAGEARLSAIEGNDIPAKEAAVAAASEPDQLLEAQGLRDLRTARDDLERRVHDLKLTRQVTMQSLPAIRLVQENDKALITKINSTLVNTVPLWETQLAQALTIHRSAAAAQAVQDASDLTNDLLTRNADTLRSANAKVRQQTERGVYDIDAVKQANAQLIATIEDSLRIAADGKVARASAETELITLETELRQALATASAQSSGD